MARRVVRYYDLGLDSNVEYISLDYGSHLPDSFLLPQSLVLHSPKLRKFALRTGPSVGGRARSLFDNMDHDLGGSADRTFARDGSILFVWEAEEDEILSLRSVMRPNYQRSEGNEA